MPEYAELHTSTHLVTQSSHGFAFTAAQQLYYKEGNGWSTTPLMQTEHWQNFTILARHRGKEIFVALKGSTAAASGLAPHCRTCHAARAYAWGCGPLPRCRGHKLAMVLRTVGKQGKNLGRRFFCCARASDSCNSFLWRTDWCTETAPVEDDGWPTESELVASESILLTFRRGMRGRFTLLDAGADLPADAHVSFVRDDGSQLVFSDPRSRLHRVWNYGLSCTARSADPLWEYEVFAAHVLGAIDSKHPAFEEPLCEVLLNQEFFNGIGNYLRAEIMLTASLPPFTKARDVIDSNFLSVCRDIVAQAVTEKNSQWRRCFRHPAAKREYDNNARAVWYFGDRGPLPGATVLKTPCCTLALYDVPTMLSTRGRLRLLAEQFGTVEKVMFHKQRPHAWIRFSKLEAAQACLEALPAKTRMRIEYKTRFGRHKPLGSSDTSSSESSEDQPTEQAAPKRQKNHTTVSPAEKSAPDLEATPCTSPSGSSAKGEPSGVVGFDRCVAIFAQHASARSHAHRLASDINHSSALKVAGASVQPRNPEDSCLPGMVLPLNSLSPQSRSLVCSKVAVIDIERASSGRAKCRQCKTAIAKGDWRYIFQTQLRRGSSRRINAYQHLQCIDGLSVDFDTLGAGWKAIEHHDQTDITVSFETAKKAQST